jgi:hypothetical protein
MFWVVVVDYPVAWMGMDGWKDLRLWLHATGKKKKEFMPGETLLRATCLKLRKLVPALSTAAM